MSSCSCGFIAFFLSGRLSETKATPFDRSTSNVRYVMAEILVCFPAGARRPILMPSDRALASRPERRAQLELFHLAIRQFRQRVDERHLARPLIGGDRLAAMIGDRLG